MKALRKSLGTKDHGLHHISTPIPIPPLSKLSLSTPPNKVIRAIAEYKSQSPQQLGFVKGDFFHVLKEVDDQGSWYEAHNPVTGARGLVPRALFEEFSKGSPASRTSTYDPPITDAVHRGTSPKTQAFYAVVLHDFIAERADELEAKAGDPISVVAQSNREWFVAKPIGRLGRPGLIPVSFVEVRDPASNQPIHDVDSLMDLGALPRVEDWKRQMLNYKATSISLGVLDEVSSQNRVSNSPFMPKPVSSSLPAEYPLHRHSNPRMSQRSSSAVLPEGILLSAEVVSFHLEMEEYWFRMHSLFQPFDPSGGNALPPAKQHVLYRCYNDFYDFQIDLLKHFPAEGGRESDRSTPRLIPYMPGPVDRVNDEVTLSRKEELNKYLHVLCKLKETDARYILESIVVRRFLAVRPGDAEVEVEPLIDEMEALDNVPDYGNQSQVDESDVLNDQMEQMRLAQQHDGSDGSDYGDRAQDLYEYGEDEYRSRDSYPAKHPFAAQNHERTRTPSTSSIHHASKYSSPSDSPLPIQVQTKSPGIKAQNHPYASGGWTEYSPGDQYYEQNDYGRSPITSPTSPSSHISRSLQSTTRMRSYSNANNINSPSISATNSQTAFVKIKIFDSVTEDLIAIRVHPMVTYLELMEKVHSRLGENVDNLRYRNSDGFVDLMDDGDLREWIDTADKHVLYAE